MRKKEVFGEQIIGVLREQGRPPAEACRRHAISGATFYK